VNSTARKAASAASGRGSSASVRKAVRQSGHRRAQHHTADSIRAARGEGDRLDGAHQRAEQIEAVEPHPVGDGPGVLQVRLGVAGWGAALGQTGASPVIGDDLVVRKGLRVGRAGRLDRRHHMRDDQQRSAAATARGSDARAALVRRL
jgi:hypothetical protein